LRCPKPNERTGSHKGFSRPFDDDDACIIKISTSDKTKQKIVICIIQMIRAGVSF
jgi:hypothetical protein